MFSQFFIDRPIFAAVVAIIMCLAGLVCMFALPVEQYPTITPVQVTVSATYPGADSKTLADAVASPLEMQINGVDNMIYMTSNSTSTGQLTLTVYFTLNTDPDVAQVQVQNRVNLALPALPGPVQQLGVSVQKKSSSIMMLIGVYSKGERYSAEYVANYANVYVLDALKRVPGAGQAAVMGMADQAMRIWMNPDRMASLGVTTSDIQQVVAQQNALYGAGQIGQRPSSGPQQQNFPVVTQPPATEPAQYENLIVRAASGGGAVVRLKDVARAEVGLRQYIVNSKFNGSPATFLAVYLQPGANGLTVSAAVRKTMEDLKSRFPAGLDYVVSLDTNDFVRISIEEVIHTLFEALILVVGVVYLFLQSLRTTLICAVAIMVSLITTFAGMLALGFSINLLTLFGLVLAIGMVVDDAIVVCENVERIMAEDHCSPYKATVKAMHEISGALIAVVLVMGSVFLPAAFLPGTTGQLYKQFAITIVVSVAVSGFVALTLTPMMCALLMRHSSLATTGFFGWFNRKVDRITQMFDHAVRLVIRRMAIAFVLFAAFIAAIPLLFKLLPTSFVPNEDQGYVFTAIILPDAASMDRTEAVNAKVDELFAKHPGVLNRADIVGYSLLDGGFKSSSGTLFITLDDFGKRYAWANVKEQNARSVLLDVYKDARQIMEGLVIPIAPPSIPGISSTGGFEFWVQDTTAGDPAQLDAFVKQILAKARQRPELTGLSTTFRATTRQLRVIVDREKSELLGVPVQDVYSAIQAQFGSLNVSQFYSYGRSWYVVLQSEPKYREHPEDIARLYVRSTNGEMVPLSAVVKTEWATGPDIVPHLNGFPAAKINGAAAPGFSSGQAIATMEEIARDVLPAGYLPAWTGLAFEEKQSGGTSAIAFAFGLIIVFLVLAAQYESWTLPGAVMSAVPFGVLGALIFNWLRGLENDVYFQIGLLVLIGLGAKNAVLRVTAAVEFRHKGLSIMEATVKAGEQRLRPIIMTSLAFALGAVPLAAAVGAGMNARHSIGTGVIGGMIGETTLAMLYVPLLFYVFDQLAERAEEKKRKAAAAAPPAQAAHGSEA